MKSLQNYIKESLIIEKYGNYAGQIEFCLALADVLYEYDYEHETEPCEINTSDLDGFENIFFDKIVINFHQPTCCILNNKSIFNKETLKFDKIVLNIKDSDITNKEELLNILNHEILHAWDNFNSILRKSNKNLIDISNEKSYKKTIPLNSDNDIERFVKELLNRIHKVEQNAYLSEFAGTLNNKNIDSFEDAKKLFIKSSTYQMYETYFKIFNDFILNGSNKLKFKFTEIYNDINSVEWTEDKIFKKLNFKISQIREKINKRMGQLWCDYLENKLKNGK